MRKERKKSTKHDSLVLLASILTTLTHPPLCPPFPFTTDEVRKERKESTKHDNLVRLASMLPTSPTIPFNPLPFLCRR